MTILQYLNNAIRNAAVHNPEVQVAPGCVLWPDKDRQWEAVIPVLQGELQELLVLGEYSPEDRTGPAIWLRCAIADKLDKVSLPPEHTPVLYLPGVSRQDLRAVESCPEPLKPLAELQYRGIIWSQLNAKDWTVLAFLKSDQGGLGLDVAQDKATRNAMQLALYRLLDEEVDLLRGKRLDQDYFNTLLTGGDPIRDLLQWLDRGDAFRKEQNGPEWKAFVEVCKSQLAFDPENQGVLAGAAKLAEHTGPWESVWERFCEAPQRYPGISDQIRKCQPPAFDLFADARTVGGWPQWNDEQEKILQRDLVTVKDLAPHEARKKLRELAKVHSARRDLVWAELGEAPLAQAMEHLALVAEATSNSMAAGSPQDMAAVYRNGAWQADDSTVRALACITGSKDVEAVTAAIRSVYLPWIEESARYLQKVWDNPGPSRNEMLPEGDCIVFVDGLRFDCAKRLTAMLEELGCEVKGTEHWSAIPTVTGTGKPAVSPVLGANGVSEEPDPAVFDILSTYQFEKVLKEEGWQVVRTKDSIPPAPDTDKYPHSSNAGKIWVEVGNIDHEGHDRGWKLARHVDALLAEVVERIDALLEAGWRTINVVTDHGWLLMPGGLPKLALPKALAETKWGRCALLKPGASTDESVYPWFWNPSQHVALADGISCYRKGEEYAHGGLSLQEALTLHLNVTRKGGEPAGSVRLTEVAWKGLRCNVMIEGQPSELSLDIRMQPGNPSSSLSAGQKSKPLKDDGTGSVIVEDEDLEGEEATLVILDSDGSLVAQTTTTVGGGNGS